eukprot:NODE_76_length_23341_cov_0.477498.p3 type:complete len:1013 gc:universal NODE_76_length_23341_cov_0.477498:6605-9643(+)
MIRLKNIFALSLLIILTYYLFSFIMIFIGFISLLSIWFKLKLNPKPFVPEIPFLTINLEHDSKRIELKYTPEINKQIKDLLEMIVKTYFSWHSEIKSLNKDFIETVEYLILKALVDVVNRWNAIDVVAFINSKILVIYLNHVRLLCRTRQHLDGDKPRSYTRSKEFEIMFATKYADMGDIHKGIQFSSASIDPSYVRHILSNLLQCVLPAGEYQSLACKTIVIEILTKLIVIPILDKCATKDFINSFIDMFCIHLLREMRMVKELRRVLEANSQQSSTIKLKSYDEFLLMINNCQNLLEAKRIRDQIVMEIRRKRLIIGEKNSNQSVNGVKVKKLIQYTNKLVLAKRRIEKRILNLGGNVPMYEQSNAMESSLLAVLNSSVGLAYFSEYLDLQSGQQVLSLHLAMEGLNHQLNMFDESTGDFNALSADIAMIINLHFAENVTHSLAFPSSIDSELRKVMESLKQSKLDFVSFAIARSILYQFIETQYFEKFKKSDLWLRMSNEYELDKKELIESDKEDLEEMEESELLGTDAVINVQGQLQHIVDDNEDDSIYSELTPVSVNPLSNNQPESTSENSTQIQSITSQIQELNDKIDKLKQHEAILSTLVKSHGKKIKNKSILDVDDAKVLFNTQTLDSTLKRESSISKSKSTFVIRALGSEDESYKILKKSLQDVQHEQQELQASKLVLENQGRDLSIKPGSVDIYIDSWTRSNDGRKEFILYLIRVKIQNGNSWNIYRRYSEFLELYEALKIEFPMLPYELPSKRPNMLYVGQLKEELASSRQSGLESYIRNLTHHEDVCQSTEFRKFLSQDIDNTRVVSTPRLIHDSSVDTIEESPKKGFSSFINKSPIFRSNNSSMSNKASSSALKESNDGNRVISDLILELFDLQESVFRKHAVSVILNQIFGGVIEKKLLESVQRLCSEEMILFYLDTLKDKLFAVQASETVCKSEETRIKIELLFPEIFGGFLGRNNAFKAAGRVFDSFQNDILNLNLITTILIELTKELFPEVERVI